MVINEIIDVFFIDLFCYVFLSLCVYLEFILIFD